MGRRISHFLSDFYILNEMEERGHDVSPSKLSNARASIRFEFWARFERPWNSNIHQETSNSSDHNRSSASRWRNIFLTSFFNLKASLITFSSFHSICIERVRNWIICVQDTIFFFYIYIYIKYSKKCSNTYES